MAKHINILPMAIFFIFIISFSFGFCAEQITITTYYPSPYGSYKELRADQMAIGSAYRLSPLPDGNLIVSGNVGIGTSDPQAKLEVYGYIKIMSQSSRPNGSDCNEASEIGRMVVVYTGDHDRGLYVCLDTGWYGIVPFEN